MLGLTFCWLASMSCKKSEHSFTTSSMVKETDGLVQQARSYFERSLKGAAMSVIPMSSLTELHRVINRMPVWEKASLMPLQNKTQGVIVPLQYNKLFSFRTSFGAGNTLPLRDQSFLCIYKDNKNDFKSTVVTMIPGMLNKSREDKNFSGYIRYENWDGTNARSYRYADGSSRQIKRKPVFTADKIDPMVSNKANSDCEVLFWYECDQIIGNTGYGCTFLGSEIISCGDNGPDPGSGGAGPGDGGGAPGGAPVNDCNDNANGIASTAQATNEKISVVTVFQSGNRRIKHYNWKIYTVSNGLIPMYIASQEEGVQSHIGNNVWRFDSFAHISESKGGTEILYNVSWTRPLANPEILTITTPRDVAKMSLSFGVTITVICEGMPVTISKPNIHASQNWHYSE